jgi:hypothetical protein
MSKFNEKNISSKTENLAGGVAMSRDKKSELVFAVLSTFLENKFYESGDERLNRIIELVKKNDAEFVAKLAIVCRNEFNLRSVTTVLIGELAKIHKGDTLVMKTIEKCALRPDDLTELVAYIGNPIPKQVRRGIRHALLNFNRYTLAKYKGENNKVKLVDIFNATHPNPKFASEEQAGAWKDLIAGELKQTDTWENEISANPTKETWENLIKEDKLGYMALIRNMNNYIKYGISDEHVKIVCDHITDVERIKKSRQLPFRFYTAYTNVQGNRRFSDAISEAMDIAVSNVPRFEGKTLIAIDDSGSMSGDPIEKAAIFGATLLKANNGADVILYDTQVQEFQGSGRTPVVDLADRIIKDANGGGTQTSLVFAYALAMKQEKNIKYDRIIIISDNESWCEGYYGSSVQQAYNEYKKLADPFIYAIDIQGYGTKDVEGGKVFHLCGWSDRLLDFIGQAEKGETIVKYIDNINI